MDYIDILNPHSPGTYKANTPRRTLPQKEEVLAEAESAMQLDFNDKYACLRKGNALIELERYEEALVAYERAIWLDSKFAIAYLGKGVACKNLSRYDDSFQAFKRAIELNPEYPQAFVEMAETAIRSGAGYEESIALLTKAIQLDPNNAIAYCDLGVAFSYLAINAKFGTRQYEDKALTVYDRAIQLDPVYAEPHHHKATVLINRKQHAEALKSLSKFIALAPQDKRGYILKYCVLRDMGRTKEAELVPLEGLKAGVILT